MTAPSSTKCWSDYCVYLPQLDKTSFSTSFERNYIYICLVALLGGTSIVSSKRLSSSTRGSRNHPHFCWLLTEWLEWIVEAYHRSAVRGFINRLYSPKCDVLLQSPPRARQSAANKQSEASDYLPLTGTSPSILQVSKAILHDKEDFFLEPRKKIPGSRKIDEPLETKKWPKGIPADFVVQYQKWGIINTGRWQGKAGYGIKRRNHNNNATI